MIKRQLHASSTNSLAEQLALEAGAIARAAAQLEIQAALDAFFAVRGKR